MRIQTVAAAAIVAVVAGVVLVGRDAPVVPASALTSEAADVAESDTERLDSGTVLVHVSGAVASPGVIELPGGSRVVDAIVAAGGALRSADLGLINLVAPVADGQHLIVPRVGESIADAPTGGGSGEAGGLIDLNTATATELETLPGIGPVLAERIVRHRETVGPFVVVEDLLDVAGIGETRLLELRSLVEV